MSAAERALRADYVPPPSPSSPYAPPPPPRRSLRARRGRWLPLRRHRPGWPLALQAPALAGRARPRSLAGAAVLLGCRRGRRPPRGGRRRAALPRDRRRPPRRRRAAASNPSASARGLSVRRARIVRCGGARRGGRRPPAPDRRALAGARRGSAVGRRSSPVEGRVRPSSWPRRFQRWRGARAAPRRRIGAPHGRTRRPWPARSTRAPPGRARARRRPAARRGGAGARDGAGRGRGDRRDVRAGVPAPAVSPTWWRRAARTSCCWPRWSSPLATVLGVPLRARLLLSRSRSSRCTCPCRRRPVDPARRGDGRRRARGGARRAPASRWYALGLAAAVTLAANPRARRPGVAALLRGGRGAAALARRCEGLPRRLRGRRRRASRSPWPRRWARRR